MTHSYRDITVGGLLERLARDLPSHTALLHGARSWTFAELDQECQVLARSLARLGIGPGDRVAVWLNNRPEWVLAFFALARLGAILVTVNTGLRSHELEYLLRQSGSCALVYMEGVAANSYRESVAELGDLPGLKHRIFVDPDPPHDALGWSGLLEPSGDAFEFPVVELEDCINMQYTSGTTGFPKGVRLTSRNIVNNAFWLGQGLGYSPEDRLCLCVPLFHCFGCVIGVLGAYTHGASLVLIDQFEPRQVLEAVQRHRCTALYGVPTMFLAELEHPDFGLFDLSSLRTGVMAGSLCPEPLMVQVMEKMHLREMTIAYGLTESSPAITQTPRHDSLALRTQTVGRVLPELEVEIRDPAGGRKLPPGQDGELVVRGYNVMQGYHNDPEATARAVDGQGWLRTGDQAQMDEAGYIRVTGRIKDIIIRGGENISPKEVEDFLRTHPDVLDVSVFGVPHRRLGETVAAAIRVRPGRPTPDLQDLQDFCRGELAHFKSPQFLVLVDEFPLTPSGKIQKFRLRESWIEQHGGLETILQS